MGGIKNIVQGHNWFLPKDDKSTTIEERHLLLKQKMMTTPTYCHFCGLILGEQKSPAYSDVKRAQDELQLGAHLKCLRENTIYK